MTRGGFQSGTIGALRTLLSILLAPTQKRGAEKTDEYGDEVFHSHLGLASDTLARKGKTREIVTSVNRAQTIVNSLLPLAAALAATLFGCVETEGPRAAVGASEAIVDGEIDEDDLAVVALTVHGRYQAFCSGTLISPSVVLTAAHCVPPAAESIENIEDIVIRFGTDVYDPFESLAVIDGWVHPAFGESGLDDDIALLRLEDRSTVMPVPPAQSPPARDSEARIVGYGITREEIGGIRRSGTTKILWAGEKNIVLEPDPSGICFGDSGGPTIADIDGRERVVGVHSFLQSECGGLGFDTRVDTYIEQLRAFVLESTPSCEPDHFCVEGCTPPDEDCPCAEDGRCSEECTRPASDPDCLTTCDANGACNESCGNEDPDCPCGADGLCDALCADDPDCPEPTPACIADGFCDEDCDEDYDCLPLFTEGEGGCSTASVGFANRTSHNAILRLITSLAI